MGQRRDQLLERAAGLPELRRMAELQPIAVKAQGARIYDVDNVALIDYTGGRGASIVGYANQFILDAVRRVLVAGVPDGQHVPQQVDLAEALGHFMPWVGSWWMCRSQDEALRAVLQWARRTTGRRVVLVLDGGDRVSSGAGLVDENDAEHASVRVAPGWSLERIEAALEADAGRVAAFVVDPLMARLGVVPAPEGALAAIFAMCRRHDVLMILDERVTGLRVDRGGAAARDGVTPDAVVMGGALGGGFPIGVVGFRQGTPPPTLADESLPAPHPVSLAAAEAIVSILKNDAIYERLEERTDQLVTGMEELAERVHRPLTVNRWGSAFALYLGGERVTDASAAARSDVSAYRRLVAELRAQGVLLPPEPLTPAFVSSAHGAKDVEDSLEAVERALVRLHQEDLP